jgi:hypothetical protein
MLAKQRDRILGTEKSQLILDIMSKGLEQTFNDNIIKKKLKESQEEGSEDKANQLTVEERNKIKSCYRKIKSVENSNKCLSKDVFEDVLKVSTLLASIDTSSSYMQGYVRNASIAPYFYFALQCELQVKTL